MCIYTTFDAQYSLEYYKPTCGQQPWQNNLKYSHLKCYLEALGPRPKLAVSIYLKAMCPVSQFIASF